MTLAARYALAAIACLFIAASASTGYAEAQRLDPQARLAKAESMFRERCKNAGEFIHRTVENVEGLLLIKVRPVGINYGDQFRMDDPYGRDLDGDGYIGSFLSASYDLMRPKVLRPGWPKRIGYRYVEVVYPSDGTRYRYTGSVREVTKTTNILMGGDGRTTFKTKEFVLDKVPAPGAPPRYGVTYDDISTREEREYWIAGSSLRVIDLKTNEVIAERVGYMIDRGQGARSGGRSPWLLAAESACPDFHRFPNPVVVVPGASAQIRQTQDFVEKVLRPIVGQ